MTISSSNASGKKPRECELVFMENMTKFFHSHGNCCFVAHFVNFAIFWHNIIAKKCSCGCSFTAYCFCFLTTSCWLACHMPAIVLRNINVDMVGFTLTQFQYLQDERKPDKNKFALFEGKISWTSEVANLLGGHYRKAS